MIGPQRFQDKVMPVPWSGCWLWAASVDSGSYGTFKVNGSVVGAHRYAYELANGPIPKGLDLDHKCRVRGCVNPDHLEAVTHAENIRRGETGKHNSIKTHCPHGHEYTAENTFYRKRKDGYRIRNCRICNRDEVRRYNARRLMRGVGVVLALMLSAPAFAQQAPVSIFAGKVTPLGYCQLTSLAASTQLSACTGGIPTGASVADIIVEAQAVRYRDDGTAPTATVGMPLVVGAEKIFVETDLTALRFIESTAGAILSISFY